MCWFSKTNFAAASSNVRDGRDSVDLCLPLFFHDPCEISLRFFEFSCASALANSPPEDVLVDMPDPGPHDEAG